MRMRPGSLIGSSLALGVAIFFVAHFVSSDHATRPARRAAVDPHATLDQLLRSADLSAGASLFGQCAACHSIGREGADLEGPNLYAVVGSAIAQRRERYAYTAALRQVGGTWTFERLNTWLTDPTAFAPGTKMAFGGLSNPQDRADVIAYLNAQGSNLPIP